MIKGKEKKNILVTGSDGFIGNKLVPFLKEENYNVFEYSLSHGDISLDPIEYIGIEHVVHLAGRTFVPDSWESPVDFYRINAIGTANVLEYCRKNKCSLTFMSTYVYGAPEIIPTPESHVLQPNTPYNHSKIIAESLCEFYHHNFGVNICILRPFNIFGEGQSDNFLIPHIVNQYLDNKSKTVEVLSLEPKRDYLYIDDMVGAICKSIKKVSGFHVYNVGSGMSFSVKEIILLVESLLKSNKIISCKETNRAGEINDIRADIALIEHELGWKPSISLREGLKRILLSKGCDL